MEVGRINYFIFTISNAGYSEANSVKLEINVNENFEYYLPRQCQKISEIKIECNLDNIKPDVISKIKITIKSLKEGDYQFSAAINYFDVQNIEYYIETEKITINVI
jgi:hypothetical protein